MPTDPKTTASPLTSLPPWAIYVLLGLLLGGGGVGAGALGTGALGQDSAPLATELRSHESAEGHPVALQRISVLEKGFESQQTKLDEIQRNQLVICAKLGAECK